MEREQAIQINDQLVIAHEAMKKARVAIAELGKQERLELDGPLYDLLLELKWQVMLPLYEQFRDLMKLELHEELPPPTSELKWSDVRLPRDATEAALDDIIMSALTSRWRKVAMIIGVAMADCEKLKLPIAPEMIGARLRFLSHADRIEGVGDLRPWGHSEVRLKDEPISARPAG
ncbi:hypothetical protein E3H11_30205 [Bradyrhizobium brasilense]|uniref:DUF3658 domain-containing protein n=1 Tax=Bradyrhizobium brasilense TaxID=1419277 RepID=UPI001456EF41|nr:DUF3658 domain-containing protein [Bradyrhizobium brasilense]NLS73106.1 hypothetical protein [Bradyrhizobium brasilense]